MASIHKTPAGTYRVKWLDPSGRQRTKHFRYRKDAAAFKAEVQVSLNRGTYVAPRAGEVRFGPYAEACMAARNDEITTVARDASIMRKHVMPRWATTPLSSVDRTAVQAWVTELGQHLSPATVAECFRLTSMVFRSACRDRILGFNPCDGVRLQRRRKHAGDDQVISRQDFLDRLLPAVAGRYQALVAVAGGTGLRWGEVAGLRWDAVNLDKRELHVIRTDVEVSGHVSTKPYPKSKAGRRQVPIPEFAVDLLAQQRHRFGTDAVSRVFVNEVGGVLWRGQFRARVWRPALVRAGLLGSVATTPTGEYRATWTDADGRAHRECYSKEARAVSQVVRSAHGGLRFHDLRHSFATWLVSDGVPINDVARILGHEQTSTTLDLYTHSTAERFLRVRQVFEADAETAPEEAPPAVADDPRAETGPHEKGP